MNFKSIFVFMIYLSTYAFSHSPATLTFQVNDEESGEGITNAHIQLVHQMDPALSYSAYTDTTGYAEIGGVKTAIEDQGLHTPTRLVLEQNYPNPFNPVTTMRFQTSQSSEVSLAIYNIRGERVRSLANQYLPSGAYSVK